MAQDGTRKRSEGVEDNYDANDCIYSAEQRREELGA
jgi:hypothetical protein